MHKAVRVALWSFLLGLLLSTLILLYTGYYKVAGVLGVLFYLSSTTFRSSSHIKTLTIYIPKIEDSQKLRIKEKTLPNVRQGFFEYS